MSYKVEHLQDSTYQVVHYHDGLTNPESDAGMSFIDSNVEFQGSLSDCDAYLRLNDRDYLNLLKN